MSESDEGERVLRIVHRTKAVHWWIDRQIADGKTNEQIAAGLPAAVAFITGRISLSDLQSVTRTS